MLKLLLQKETGLNTEISARVKDSRSLSSRPTDFLGGFKDHKNEPKKLQGITNLPENPCRSWQPGYACRLEMLSVLPRPAFLRNHTQRFLKNSVCLRTGLRQQCQLSPNLATPLSWTTCNFLCLHWWEERLDLNSRTKREARNGVVCFSNCLSVWLGEMTFLASGSPDSEESLCLQKCFRIFKGKINH